MQNELRKSQLINVLPVINKRQVYCKIVRGKALVLTGTHAHANAFSDIRLLKGDVQILSGADGVSYFKGERLFIINQHGTIQKEVWLRTIRDDGAMIIEDNALQ